MKRNTIKSLLYGAATLLAVASFTGCKNTVLEKLETRVSVLEGMVEELKEDLQKAVVTGSTVTSAVEKDGVWTLTLSSGQVITIKPSSGSISIKENADNIIITVDGKDYVLPKGSAGAPVNSLVFVPMNGELSMTVTTEGGVAYFLATPALTAEQLAEAEFAFADARELAVKAGDNLFKVEAAELDGDLLKVTIAARSAKENTDYIAALKLTIKGVAVSSNYFVVHVKDNEFDPEQLVDPSFVEGVEVTKLEGALDGFWKAHVPNSAVTFAGTTDLKEYFSALPNGKLAFVLAPAEQQNGNVQGRYQAFKDFLHEDGIWEPTYRLASDAWGNGDGPEDPNGFLVYVTADDVIKHKIYFKIDNFVHGMGLNGVFGEGFPEAQHIECGVEESVNMKWICPPGAYTIDLAEYLLKAEFPEGELLPDHIYLRHGNANKAIQMVQDVNFEWGGDTVFGNDGAGHFYLDGALKAVCSFSRGLCFRTTQPSWVSSIRENWPDDAKAACNGPANGEILGGWDGGGDIPGLMGWDINEKGLVFSDSYEGWGFRSGVGAYIETFYTNDHQIGPWHWFYMFFNRRVAPYEEGKGLDPDAR